MECPGLTQSVKVQIMELIERQSLEIAQKALADYKPVAIILMVSGGRDSSLAAELWQRFGLPVTGLLHVNTQTGISETTQFVRGYARLKSLTYLEADTGNAYEDYVIRKGFWGRGFKAHSMSYQLLKATPYRKVIAREYRKRQRDRRVLLVNGIRSDESENRKYNYTGYQNADPGAPSNIWLNFVWDWTRQQRDDYLADSQAPINPVTDLLHRSGECFCGTMQSDEDRRVAKFFFPAWGSRLDKLEQRAIELHGYGWGCPVPKWIGQQRKGQLGLSEEFFLPMCQTCNAKGNK